MPDYTDPIESILATLRYRRIELQDALKEIQQAIESNEKTIKHWEYELKQQPVSDAPLKNVL